MIAINSRRVLLAASAAAALVLSGCGGGGDNNSAGVPSPTPSPTPAPPPPSPPPAAQTAFSETKLVSDTAAVGGATLDPNMVDGWGIVFAPNAPVWVNDNGTNKSTLYDGNGAIQSLVVSIPPGVAPASGPTGGNANPTGIVFNGTNGFAVTEGGKTGPASFIFVGEEGTISGWSQNVDNGNAITAVDNSNSGAVYKGVGIFTQGGTNLLFVPNFRSGAIEVYDSSFHKTTVPGGFTDPNLPAGYAPFNVQVIGSQVFVAYAHTTNGFDEDDGAGLGMLDVFDTSGNLVKRLVTGGALNAPWGIAMAPANFGTFSNDLLVGNFGDGKINIYDPNTGALVGTLSDANGNPIVIDGLWGIAFGNGAFNQPTTTLYFAAGPNSESHGLYGRLDIAGTYTPPAAPGGSTPPSTGY